MSRDCAPNRVILVDVREKWFPLDTFEKFYKVPVISKQLPVGDFWICEASDLESPLVIVERKANTDLIQSIHDGRYHEQKYRLTQTNKWVVIVVEGLDWNSERYKGMREKQAMSAICHTMTRERFNVIMTEGESGTMMFLSRLATSPMDQKESGEKQAMRAAVSGIRKRGAVDGKTTFVQQLSCIHGISDAKALPIAEKYKSMCNFVRVLEESGEKGSIRLFEDLRTADGKTCGIGQVLAKRIYHQLVDGAGVNEGDGDEDEDPAPKKPKKSSKKSIIVDDD